MLTCDRASTGHTVFGGVHLPPRATTVAVAVGEGDVVAGHSLHTVITSHTVIGGLSGWVRCHQVGVTYA